MNTFSLKRRQLLGAAFQVPAAYCALLGLPLTLAGCENPVSSTDQKKPAKDGIGFDYPETRRDDIVDDYFGTQVADPYRWLEDVESAEVDAWITAQNALGEDYLSGYGDLRNHFRNQLQGIVFQDVAYPPFQVEGRWFQYRIGANENQKILYWGEKLDRIDRVLIDINAISNALGEPQVLGFANISPDGGHVAYALHAGGSDWAVVRFREIESGNDLPEEIGGIRFSEVAWDPHSSGVYYFQHQISDEGAYTFAPYQADGVKYHRINTPVSEDQVVGGVDLPGALLSPSVSEDGSLFLLQGEDLDSFRQQYIFYRPANDASAPFQRLQNPDKSLISLVGVRDGEIYFTTFFNSSNGRIVKTPLAKPEVTHWVDVVPPSELPLTSFGPAGRIVGDYVVSRHEDIAFNRIRLTSLVDGAQQDVNAPIAGRLGSSTGAATALEASLSADRSEIILPWTSAFVEHLALGHNPATGETRMIGQPESWLDYENYTAEVIWATSADGTRVPVSLHRRKDILPDGQRPTLFYAYGHAGLSALYRPYAPFWAVWMRNGGILATVHARGGGELGQDWHTGGIGAHQQNTFSDCIAGVEAVQQAGWTAPEHSAFNGRSGGGLTTGAVMTQRPDLLAAAVPEVGVYDVLRYHILASRETEEVGTSETEEQFNWIYPYSPLHAIKPEVVYPATLIMIGEFDNRVHPAHSYKFAAALQATPGAQEKPVLLRVQRGEGHGIAERSSVVDSRADFLTFIAATTGMRA